MNALISSWKKWIKVGLEEDSVSFDWTARATQSAHKHTGKESSAVLVAKANGIWAADAGLKALEILSDEMGLPVHVVPLVRDGEKVSPKQKCCGWEGSPEAIVMFERTFINLASYCGGIATQAREIVSKVQSKGLKNPPRITGTRKTLPGYRDLAIQSTLIGGAYPHRYNLSGGLLLKENHVSAAGSIAAAIAHARKIIPHVLKIEIEVRDHDELRRAIQAGAEIIMLDNFEPDLIREAIKLKPANVCYEVSGGINVANIDQYLIEGLDVISVGSITHSVKALDLSLLMNELV